MPLSTLRLTPRGVNRKTQGQDGVALSFLVGLFHPLQHAVVEIIKPNAALLGLGKYAQPLPSLRRSTGARPADGRTGALQLQTLQAQRKPRSCYPVVSACSVYLACCLESVNVFKFPGTANMISICLPHLVMTNSPLGWKLGETLRTNH